MGRREFHPPHFFEDDACYFVTAHTVGHDAFFGSAGQRDVARDALRAAVERHHISLYAWVILPDHYHLLLRAGQGASLSKFIKRLHGDSAIRLNEWDGIAGRKVWYQYWDTIVRDVSGFWGYMNYVHINPLKHGYVRLNTGVLRGAGGRVVLGADEVSEVHLALKQYAHSSYHYYVRKYGADFLTDAWMRYPIPVSLAGDEG